MKIPKIPAALQSDVLDPPTTWWVGAGAGGGGGGGKWRQQVEEVSRFGAPCVWCSWCASGLVAGATFRAMLHVRIPMMRLGAECACREVPCPSSRQLPYKEVSWHSATNLPENIFKVPIQGSKTKKAPRGFKRFHRPFQRGFGLAAENKDETSRI